MGRGPVMYPVPCTPQVRYEDLLGPAATRDHVVREMLWPLPLYIHEVASVSWAKRVTRQEACTGDGGGWPAWSRQAVLASACVAVRESHSAGCILLCAIVHASGARKVVDVCGLCGMQVASRQPLGPRL